MKKKETKKSRKKKLSRTTLEYDNAASGPVFKRAWRFLVNLSASSGLFLFCAILLPFIALANFPSYLALQNDFDIWFHLAYGREYVQNITWSLDHAQYSWTPAYSEWMYAWFGSALMYVVHQLAGVHGLFALHYMILGLSAGAVLWLARLSGVRQGLWLLTAFLAATHIVSLPGVYVKPEMFSTLLVCLTTMACLRFRMAPGPWIIVVLPLIFLFWVNTHGLWFFGLAFLGLFVSLSILEHLFLPKQGMDRNALVMLSVGAGLAILALAANPDGIAHPANIISTMFVSDPEVIGMIREVSAYESLWPHLLYSGKPSLTITVWIMSATLFAFSGTWLHAWKRIGRADLPVAAAVVIFFFIGMYMARLALVYAMVWLPSMIFLVWRLGAKPAFPRAGPIILAAFLLLSVLTAAKVAFIYEDRRWLGLGYQDYVPEKEVAFIMDNNLPGPIFNCYLTGAYMMWKMYPAYKVFIDPRHYPYLDQIVPDYMALGQQFPYNKQGLEAFMARYPFRIALVQHKHVHLITWLNNSPEWHLAYFDKNASVLIHMDVVPKLSLEARAMSLSPERYEYLSNPSILQQLFAYYHLFGANLSAVIRDYYEQNVSNLYVLKKSTLATMDDMLAEKRGQEAKRK